MVNIATVIEFLEEFAPSQLAAQWDNVGLLLGDQQTAVQRIMTCLTVTPPSAAEALGAGAQLIVSHHPILFRPIKRLTTATPEGRMLLELIRGGIAVYSLHTAFDNTAGGINELLARKLDLQEVGPLRQGASPRRCKVVVFVPDMDLERVSQAMFAAGAGNIGQYSQCSFRTGGTGTFFGSEEANPTIGRKGRREEVTEWRLEAICPEAHADAVVAALRGAHSYEEPAYDVYPLRSQSLAAGEGRKGRLPAALSLAELARVVKTRLPCQQVQFVGDPARSIETIAVVCGAGGEFLADAIRESVDVLLTGELRFHDYLAARAEGLALLLPGHYATERPGVEELAARLQAKWPDLQVWASRQEADPLHWV
ncbi:MAG TPA: Nif3-like dinuclear metal center hexameric protein [Gemmataceae bacterium]|nr:Nif3-like dinuclear metal center hexameric protein [Gemmataceae bacterium]